MAILLKLAYNKHEPFDNDAEKYRTLMHWKRKFKYEVLNVHGPQINFDFRGGEEMIQKMEQHFHVNVYAWTRYTRNGKFSQIRKSSGRKDRSNVDIIVRPPIDDKIDLYDIGLLVDEADMFPETRQCKPKVWTLAELIAISKNPGLKTDVLKLREERTKLEYLWGQPSVRLDEMKILAKLCQ